MLVYEFKVFGNLVGIHTCPHFDGDFVFPIQLADL